MRIELGNALMVLVKDHSLHVLVLACLYSTKLGCVGLGEEQVHTEMCIAGASKSNAIG